MEITEGGEILEAEEARTEDNLLLSKKQLEALDNLEVYYKKVHSPLQYLEHRLHAFTSYVVMPVFALANAGVALGGGITAPAVPAALGTALGLVLGTPSTATAQTERAELANVREVIAQLVLLEVRFDPFDEVVHLALEAGVCLRDLHEIQQLLADDVAERLETKRVL